jgi:Fanconi anemia group M protein
VSVRIISFVDSSFVKASRYEMVVSCLRANTLVCLPTGLGKTFVAAVVMYNFYSWHPDGKAKKFFVFYFSNFSQRRIKIVFLAPTKPLVAQQVEACYNVMGIPYSEISEMTGSVDPRKRNSEWKEKRCFFVTPQVLHNDLNRGALDPMAVRCVIVDEAHRARGNYAYVNVIRSIAARQKKFS